MATLFISSASLVHEQFMHTNLRIRKPLGEPFPYERGKSLHSELEQSQGENIYILKSTKQIHGLTERLNTKHLPTAQSVSCYHGDFRTQWERIKNLQPLGSLSAMELCKSGFFTHHKSPEMPQVGHHFGALTAFLKIPPPSFQHLFCKSHQSWELISAPQKITRWRGMDPLLH